MPLWLVRMFLIGRTSLRSAGPRVAPEKTKLAGPKVVRIEKPDPVAPPRRHRDGGGPGSAPAARWASVGRPSPGGGGVRNTRRRDQSRGGGGAGAKNRGLGEVTPFDWRQQDYADREQRLQKSEGASSTAFAGMSARKMSPPVKRPRPSSRPVALPPFSLRWC